MQLQFWGRSRRRLQSLPRQYPPTLKSRDDWVMLKTPFRGARLGRQPNIFCDESSGSVRTGNRNPKVLENSMPNSDDRRLQLSPSHRQLLSFTREGRVCASVLTLSGMLLLCSPATGVAASLSCYFFDGTLAFTLNTATGDLAGGWGNGKVAVTTTSESYVFSPPGANQRFTVVISRDTGKWVGGGSGECRVMEEPKF